MSINNKGRFAPTSLTLQFHSIQDIMRRSRAADHDINLSKFTGPFRKLHGAPPIGSMPPLIVGTVRDQNAPHRERATRAPSSTGIPRAMIITSRSLKT